MKKKTIVKKRNLYGMIFVLFGIIFSLISINFVSAYVWNFSTASDYIYNISEIVVSGGNAYLNGTNSLYSWWRLNENISSLIGDNSGNNYNGTIINNASWIAGKLNSALQFNGATQYINFTNTSIANFERTELHSYEFWIKTSTTPSNWGTVFGKYDTANTKGFMVYIDNLPALDFLLATSGTNYLYVRMSGIIADGNWSHIVVTYDGSSSSSGVKIYKNSVLQNMTVLKDNLAGSILTSENFKIGKDSSTNYFTGSLDEIIIYNKILSQSEINFRYNNGTGTENSFGTYNSGYYLIQPKNNFSFLTLLGSFSESALKTGGDIGYCISNDTINFKYWNGSSWINSTCNSTQINNASDINSYINLLGNLGNFSFKAILHSIDGSYTPYLYNISVLEALPPSLPIVYNPITAFYHNNFPINYTASISPNNFSVNFYNITLLNLNLTFNKIIIANNSNNLGYIYNSSLALDGFYIIKVTACDINNLCSSGFSDYFEIDNTLPYGDLIDPTNNSYLTNPAVNFTINAFGNQLTYYLCYQESTNTTNQNGLDGTCGLNFSGNNSFLALFDWINRSAIYDGNWNTYSVENGAGGTNVNFFYHKPNFVNSSLNNIIWQVKNGIGISNISLPVECYNYSDFLDLVVSSSLGDPSTKYYCMLGNGGGELLLTNSGNASFYEEAIIWNITQYTSSPLSNLTLNVYYPNGTLIHQETIYTNESSGLFGIVYTFLANGIYDWFYTIYDMAGNFFQTVTRILNIIAVPIISISYPINNSTYDYSIIHLDYSVSNGDSCWYSLDNGIINISSGCGTQSITGLISNNGINIWNVYANNSIGNLSFEQVIFNSTCSSPTNPVLTLDSYPYVDFNTTYNIRVSPFYIGISNIKLQLTDPNNNVSIYNMVYDNSSHYSLTFIFDMEGNYNFVIYGDGVCPSIVANITGTLVVRKPYYVTICGYNDKSLNPYKNEFAYLTAEYTSSKYDENLDRFITPLGFATTFKTPVFHTTYDNGCGTLKLYEANRNYTLRLFDGIVAFDSDYSSPNMTKSYGTNILIGQNKFNGTNENLKVYLSGTDINPYFALFNWILIILIGFVVIVSIFLFFVISEKPTFALIFFIMGILGLLVLRVIIWFFIG